MARGHERGQEHRHRSGVADVNESMVAATVGVIPGDLSRIVDAFGDARGAAGRSDGRVDIGRHVPMPLGNIAMPAHARAAS